MINFFKRYLINYDVKYLNNSHDNIANLINKYTSFNRIYLNIKIEVNNINILIIYKIDDIIREIKSVKNYWSAV